MTKLDDKIKYLNDLKSEQIERPGTKQEYLDLLTQTEREIRDILTIEQKAQEDLQKTPEYLWAQVRSQRNSLLAECDWTQLPDAPCNTLAWRVYRQALRDITLQPDPANIIWPERPQ